MGFCIQCCVLYFWHQHRGCAKDPIKGGRPEFLLPLPQSCKMSIFYIKQILKPIFNLHKQCTVFPLFFYNFSHFCDIWQLSPCPHWPHFKPRIKALPGGRLMVTFLEMMVAKMVYTLSAPHFFQSCPTSLLSNENVETKRFYHWPQVQFSHFIQIPVFANICVCLCLHRSRTANWS